jgi:Amt family ammonium transporter
MVLCLVGTGMLWFGWYGFNAGSAVAADRIASNAFVATTLSAAVGLCVWGILELVLRGKPSVLGLCSGAVAGLATITPASGFVTPSGAVLIGILAGISTFLACAKLKNALGYDDSLDTFGVHAVGGTVGTVMAGFLASSEMNPNLLADRIHQRTLQQRENLGINDRLRGNRFPTTTPPRKAGAPRPPGLLGRPIPAGRAIFAA